MINVLNEPPAHRAVRLAERVRRVDTTTLPASATVTNTARMTAATGCRQTGTNADAA
jgi:hypothetical protein